MMVSQLRFFPDKNNSAVGVIFIVFGSEFIVFSADNIKNGAMIKIVKTKMLLISKYIRPLRETL